MHFSSPNTVQKFLRQEGTRQRPLATHCKCLGQELGMLASLTATSAPIMSMLKIFSKSL